MTLAALAQRTEVRPVLTQPPQQSDYVALWQKHTETQTKPKATPDSRLSRLRIALNPFWPYWLREWKRALIMSRNRGSPRLGNPDQFRRLSWQEIRSERRGNGDAQPQL
jgi:hypothetical protein